jgi:methionyl-tRNA formyltransferase
VKSFAIENGSDLIQPETVKDESIVEKIKNIEPVIGVVISYGKIIPRALFSIPQHQTINVHYSLLPRYRGAAPVQRAIENGEKKTGITIFELKKKMDSGDIWAQKEFNIFDTDTTGSLWERLSNEGAPFLVDTIQDILTGQITKTAQDNEKATYAGMVEKGESKVDWSMDAKQIVNKLRAYTPWPGLCCTAKDKLFKLSMLGVCEKTPELRALSHDKDPGSVLSMDKRSLKVCCGNNTVVEILEIQPPGKKPMSPYNYCLGNELPDRLC